MSNKVTGTMFAFRFITGVMIGLEFGDDYVIIDLIILRIIVSKCAFEEQE